MNPNMNLDRRDIPPSTVESLLAYFIDEGIIGYTETKGYFVTEIAVQMGMDKSAADYLKHNDIPSDEPEAE